MKVVADVADLSLIMGSWSGYEWLLLLLEIECVKPDDGRSGMSLDKTITDTCHPLTSLSLTTAYRLISGPQSVDERKF